MTSNSTTPDEFVARVRRIDWMSAAAPTSEAEALLREYARRVGALARHFAKTRRFTLEDTDTHIAGVGMSLPASAPLLDALYDALAGIPVKEHIVINLHGYYFWNSDPELAAFENPFEPLVQLYERGYTTAGGVADDGSHKLEMSLGSRAGIGEYLLDV